MMNKITSKVALAAFAVCGLGAVANATAHSAAPTHADPAGMKVTVGGFFKFAGIAAKSKPDFDTLNGNNIRKRRGDFWMDAEVIIKADNHFHAGCHKYNYGAEVQLEANPGEGITADTSITNTSTTPSSTINFTNTQNRGSAAFINADKVYMYISNDSFGRVEAGSTDSAISSMFHYVNGFATGGIDGIYEDVLGSEIVSSAFKPKSHGKALKVYYVTPRFEGFQFGMSQAPVVGRKGRAVTRSRVSLSSTGTAKLADQNFENSGEYAMNYVNTFYDSIGVKLSAGFSHAHPIHSTNSHEPWRAFGFGAMFTYAGFSVSGTYTNNGKSGYFKGSAANPILSNKKEQAFSAGLQYETGPYVIGTNYVNMRTAGDTSVAGYNKSNVWAAGATWKAAPGLSLFVEGVTARRTIKSASSATSSMALLGSRVDW